MVRVKRFPITPSQPQRICWGCDLYCAADAMRCGNGSVRTPHPVELFGDDWQDWGPGDAALPTRSGASGDDAALPPAHGTA